MNESSYNEQMQTPDDVDMLSFFESEPSESTPEDGYWCYSVRDSMGVELQFSFNLLERSVQTAIYFGEKLLCQVYRECANSIQFTSIEGAEWLVADFSTPGHKGNMRLTWKQGVQVTWSDLQV